MRASVSIGLGVLAVLAGVPPWAIPGHRYVPASYAPRLVVRAVPLDPRDPSRRRVGGLFYLGGVSIAEAGDDFGGYSALAVRGRAFTLLSDRGTTLRFRMGRDWRPRGAWAAPLPAGPGTGWVREDRDSESLALRPDGRVAWVGFERENEFWAYRVDADGTWAPATRRRPATMADWPDNGGAESLARLPDGRFVVLSESRRPPGARRGREGLVFAGDPTRQGTPVFRFTYMPERGFEPADAAALPDGRLLVLERGFTFPNSWRNRLMVVPAGALRPGAVVAAREIARLARPLVSDNFEGLAVDRERGAAVIWLVSDDNQASWQRTLLLKFRLEE